MGQPNKQGLQRQLAANTQIMLLPPGGGTIMLLPPGGGTIMLLPSGATRARADNEAPVTVATPQQEAHNN